MCVCKIHQIMTSLLQEVWEGAQLQEEDYLTNKPAKQQQEVSLEISLLLGEEEVCLPVSSSPQGSLG